MTLQEAKTGVQRAHFLLLPQNFCFDLRVQRTFKDITLVVSVLRNCVEVILTTTQLQPQLKTLRFLFEKATFIFHYHPWRSCKEHTLS